MKPTVWLIAATLIPGAAAAQNPAAPLARAQMEAQIKANFVRMDANRDGVLTRQESAAARDTAVNARINAMFDALDGDKNGAISRAEFAAANRKAMTKATAGKPAPDRDFDLADTNKDGRVTVAEASLGPLRQFDTADSNKDGSLSATERQAAAARQRQRR